MTNFSIILLGVFRKRLMQYEAIKKRRLVIQAGFFPNNAQKRSGERRVFFSCSCGAAVDMVFLLCDGWASASRRSYIHSSLRVDRDSQPPRISLITSSLTGKNHAPDRAREPMLSAPVSNRPLLPMLLRTTHFCRVNDPSARFFSNLHARSPVVCPCT